MDSENEDKTWDYLKLSYNSLVKQIGKTVLSTKQVNTAHEGNGGINHDYNNDDNALFEAGISETRRLDEFLYNKICVELGYCKNKQNFDFIDVKKMAEFLFYEIKNDQRFANRFGVPVSILVAVLIKQGLSNFCKC